MLDIRIETYKESYRAEWEQLLSSNDLSAEDCVDETLLMFQGNKLIGTCSSKGKIIKMFALDKDCQGQGYASILLTKVLNKLFDKGHYTVLAYTPSRNVGIFEAMQFRCIYDTGTVALVSIGLRSLERQLETLKMVLGPVEGSRGAVVMNGNPFSKGHAYLIEEASKKCDRLVVFVVEENRSSFTTAERVQLIQKGTAHLNNVTVVLGGEFIISSATFPQYFERSQDKIARWSAELDAGIFIEYFVKTLEINIRFVGSEPYCSLTNTYNQALKNKCIGRDIEIIEIPRLEIDACPVSASIIRKLIRHGDWDSVKKLVPPTTYAYLTSAQAMGTVQKLKSGVLKEH